MSEDRTGLELEDPVADRVFDDQGSAGHIGGHQIRGELNPAKVEVQRLAEGSDQQRLAQPRRALEENVPAGQHGREDAPHHLALADDRQTQRVFHPLGHRPERLRGHGRIRHLHPFLSGSKICRSVFRCP